MKARHDTSTILLLHDGAGPLRGSEQVMFDLVRGLSACRWVILTNHHAFAEAARCLPGVQQVRLEPVRALLGGPSRLGDFRDLLRQGAMLRRMIAETGASIVHVNNATFCNWAVLAGWWTGVPVIAHVHSPLSRRSRFRLGVHAADRVVGVSAAILDDSTSHPMVRARCHVIYNGYAPRKVTAADRAVARGRHGIGVDTLVIGVVGVLLPAKRVDVAVEALRLLPPDLLKRTVLLIAGDGEARQALERQAEGLPVKFLGQVSNVPELLADVIDFLLMPSEMEAFSIVLLEAAGAALPRIASNAGGNPESIRDGEDGLLVPPGDPALLARTIASLAADPSRARSLGQAAAARLAREFSPERFLSAFGALYDDVLAHPTGRFSRVKFAILTLLRRNRRD